jgi:hypothetical protein
MKAQTPAEGIVKTNDWGLTKTYKVVCSCHDDDHSHNVWVEVEDYGEIAVIVYTTTISPFWSLNRWRQMWQLLTRGYVKSEVALSMTEQQALNYAETLNQAIKDIKTLQVKQNGNS